MTDDERGGAGDGAAGEPAPEDLGPGGRAPADLGPADLGPADLGPGPLTRVRRLSERGRYDRETVHAILDAALYCHLGFETDGQPMVLPTLYGRSGDALYLHGAPANHSLRRAGALGRVCVTVSVVDELVLARSAFHHSLNYRSVVAFGPAEEVVDADEKVHGFSVILEHVVPGRGADARPPSPSELRATRLVRFEIAEASAKVRTGPPKEEPEDLARDDIWAGRVPLQTVVGQPIVDTQGPIRASVPPYVSDWSRGTPVH